MAKAKSGGTRSYIRGRVGADVYSIGRDSKGKKQQVVRSLAETVANPQTQSQMRGRMIMSTIMQVVAALKPIIDHAFDNVTGRQPNISEFIARNYAAIKADVASNPSSSNKFGLNKFQEKGAKQGQYVISDGQAQLPAALSLAAASGVITIAFGATSMTIGNLKQILSLSTDEYFTLVGISNAGAGLYERFRVNPTLADTTVITGSNIADVFAVEGNAAAVVAVASTSITITLSAVAGCAALIISKKTAAGYIHNEATLAGGNGFEFNADAALPTYPVGTADYLNGGDIFGMNENFNDGGGTPTPEPATPHTLTLSKSGNGTVALTVDSETIQSGASVDANKQVSIAITPESGKSASATVNGTSISLSAYSNQYVGSFRMPNADATLVVNTAVDGGGDEPDQ